jgi:hypothetical protein
MKCTWCDGTAVEPEPGNNRIEELTTINKEMSQLLKDALLCLGSVDGHEALQLRRKIREFFHE